MTYHPPKDDGKRVDVEIEVTGSLMLEVRLFVDEDEIFEL